MLGTSIWAIQPEWLAWAERMIHGQSLPASLKVDSEARLLAMAPMGRRLEGTRHGVVRGSVAALPIMGPISPRANLFTEIFGGVALDALSADVRAVAAHKSIETLLFVVDSPGGEVVGVHEFADMLAGFNKPVIAHVTGAGASAAYWIASQANELIVDATACVGSIGVLFSACVQEGLDANGQRTLPITSRHAPMKRPDLTTEEGRASLQACLDAVEAVFVDGVCRGRRVSRETVLQDFGQGGDKAGHAAVAAKMADRVDTLHGTLSRLVGLGQGASSPRRPSAIRAREVDIRRRRSAL